MHRPRLAQLVLYALALVWFPLDWGRLVGDGPDFALHPLSNLAKLASSFVACALAWTAGSDALDRADARRFRRMFALVFAGDVAFIAGAAPIGIALFFAFQVLLVARNLAGLGRARLGSTALAASLLPPLVILLVYLALLVPHIGDPALRAAIPVYVAILWLSVAAGGLGWFIGARPAVNRRRMWLGLWLFALCDMTVGLNLILDPHGRAQIIPSSLTWTFYAPALWCIAASVYRPPTRAGAGGGCEAGDR